MAHFKDSIFINAPVEKVNAVVGDPHRWASFIVGMSEPEKISGDQGLGAAAEHKMALMWGMRGRVTTKVTEERHDPDGSTFWRWEQKGTAPAWWTCYHQPREGGTLASSELDYTMPWGIVGKAMDRLFVGRTQKRDMRRTMENVKRLAEESQPGPLGASQAGVESSARIGSPS